MKRTYQSLISLVLLALLCFGIAIASEPLASISGLYEVCIGVRDVVPEIPCWEFFGYRNRSVVVRPGKHPLLQSIRLCHLDADHGLELYDTYGG